MLFDRLCLHNFQRYAGTFEIEFPDPEKHSSLVVVLAPNNTGKTTLIRALRFLFYGEMTSTQNDDSPSARKNQGTTTEVNAWDMVNDLTRDGAGIGDNVQAWVEARLRIGNDGPITIRRSLTVRKIDERGRWFVEGPSLHVKKSDNKGEKFQKDDGLIQAKINRTLPEDLCGWFYFRGEPTEGKMAHGGTEDLRDSLQRVIQLQRWQASEDLVDKLIRKIEGEIAKEVGANAEYQQIQRQLTTVQDGLKATKDGILKCDDLLEEGRIKLEALESKTDQMAAAANQAKEILATIRSLESTKATAQREADKASRDYRERVAKLGGLPFLHSLFSDADFRLEGLRKRNLLPAEVSKPFIERLLKQKACVCGRPHDEAAMHALREYLKGTLETQTNSDLLELSRQLDPENGSPFRSRLRGHADELRRMREAEESARRRAGEIGRQLDGLQPPDNGDMSDFENLLKDRRTLAAKIENIRDKKREFQQTSTNQDQAIKRYRSQLSAIGGGKRSGKVPELYDELAKAQKLLDAIRLGKDQFEASVASILRRRLSELFDGAVTSGNTATISSRSFLPMIRTAQGTIERNPGGGEKQVLELAFVIALSELRREINETIKEAGLGGNLLGPQSFVLDSPFTSVDPNYMRVIADFLPGKARQMILLVAKQNWHDTIREALEKHITMAYAVTLHTSSVIKEPDAYCFDFKGKKHELLKRLPGNERTFTTFSRI